VVRGCQAPKRISAQPGGAEASTVGVYRAELHKRALQWERTTAYLAPSKAVGEEMNCVGADIQRLPEFSY